MGFFRRFRLRRGERHPSLRPWRRWLRFLIIGLVSLAGILALAYFLRVPLRDDLIRRVLALAREEGIEVDYQAVWGDLFTGINFKELVLLQDSDHYLNVEELRVSYRLLPLIIENRVVINSVNMKKPQGRWILPEKPREEREPFDPDFSLDLTRLVIRDGSLEFADTLKLDSIELNTSLRIRPHQIQGTLRRGSISVMFKGKKRLDIKKAGADLGYKSPDTLVIEDLILNTPGSALEADAVLEGGSWKAELDRLELDLTELGVGNLGGRLTGKGLLARDSSGFAGELHLQGRELVYGEQRLARIDADIEGAFGFFDVVVAAGDPELGEVAAFGSVMVDTQMLSTELKVQRAHLQPGSDWPLTFMGGLSGVYRFRKGSGFAKGLLSDIQLGRMSWESFAFDLAFASKELVLKEFLLKEGLERIKAEGSLKGDKLEGSVCIQSLQLTSLGRLNPLGAAAEADAELDISGTVKSPRVSGVLLARSQEAFFQRLEADLKNFYPLSLEGEALLQIDGIASPSKERIDVKASIKDSYLSAEAESGPQIGISTQGRLNLIWDQNSYRYNCDELLVRVDADTVRNRFPFVAGYEADSVYLGPTFLYVGEGELATTGSWHPGSLPRWELSLYDIQLGTVGRMLNLPPNTTGMIWGQIASRGGPGERLIVINIDAKDVTSGEVRMDSLAFLGTLDTASLGFDAVLLRDQGRSTADGIVYYDFSDSIPLKNFKVDAVLDDIGTWPFDFLDKIVEVKGGTVKGELHAEGSFAEPNIKGWVNVEGTELYVPVIDLRSQNADAEILFAGDKVILDMLDARVGDGSVQGRGDYALISQNHPFFFSFRARNVVYSPERHIHAVTSGSLSLSGADFEPLWIKGDMEVKEALVTYGLGNEIKVTAPTAPPVDTTLPPTYVDLEVKGEKNIWIRNNDMDAEVSPDLYIKLRDDPIPQITGELNLRRGSLYYLDHRFRLDASRSRVVFPPTQELDPQLNIWAQMRTGEIDSSRGKPEPVTIILHMAGSMTEPILEFFSEPPVWSESEILSYLHLNLATAFVEGVVRDITGPVQSWARLDVFSIEDLATQGLPAKVTFGKYIQDRLFASYTLALARTPSNPNQHQFTVEYDIDTTRHNQQIILERDEEGAHSLRYQIKFRY